MRILILLLILFLGCESDSSVTGPSDCDGIEDNCGVCNGDNSTCDTDGGDTDGGDTDGGETDGGETDGGETDGGETDGGQTDGGSTDGGLDCWDYVNLADCTNDPNCDWDLDLLVCVDIAGGTGGETDGGETGGGETDGGETDGGETDGGETDGGDTGGVSGGCDLPINTVYLDGGHVLYNVDFIIGGFQWNVDDATVDSSSGGDAEAAGFTVQANGSMVIAFSFTGGSIPQGCGTLTEMVLSGNATGLSGIVFSSSSGVAVDVTYYNDSNDNSQ